MKLRERPTTSESNKYGKEKIATKCGRVVKKRGPRKPASSNMAKILTDNIHLCNTVDIIHGPTTNLNVSVLDTSGISIEPPELEREDIMRAQFSQQHVSSVLDTSGISIEPLELELEDVMRAQFSQQHVSILDTSGICIEPPELKLKDVMPAQFPQQHVSILDTSGISIEPLELELEDVMRAQFSQQHVSILDTPGISIEPPESECKDVMEAPFSLQQVSVLDSSGISIGPPELEREDVMQAPFYLQHVSILDTSAISIEPPELEREDVIPAQFSQQHVSEVDTSVIFIKSSESENEGLIFPESALARTSIKNSSDDYDESVSRQHTDERSQSITSSGHSIHLQHASKNVQADNSIDTITEKACGGAVPRRPTTFKTVNFDSEPRSSHHFGLNKSVVMEDIDEEVNQSVFHQPRMICKPGKSWKRISLHKDSLVKEGEGFKRRPSRRSSLKIVPLNRPIEIKGNELDTISENFGNISLNTLDITGSLENATIARQEVLLKCDPQQPVPFKSLYNKKTLENCKKIGEGTFGEVFLFNSLSEESWVIKVIPIEGDQLVNGAKQKKFSEILSEITITKALSDLRRNNTNFADTFNELKCVRCVQGKYPPFLTKLWKMFDRESNSENDHPRIFPSTQLYIVLELRNGGRSFQGYRLEGPYQSYSIFQQVAFSLAVAETQLKFEHRDLHLGNVLLSKEKAKTTTFLLDGREYCVPTSGIKATIIDFTLSRVEMDDMVIYNDLAEDNLLFEGDSTVDYQFEIYRLMQKKNGNNWQNYQPYTNLLWLHYLLEKAICLKYRRKKHKQKYIRKLKALKKEVLNYDCVSNFVKSKFIMPTSSEKKKQKTK